MVLSVPGVDYESLDRSEQEYAVKRLEGGSESLWPRLSRLPISLQVEPARRTVREI